MTLLEPVSLQTFKNNARKIEWPCQQGVASAQMGPTELCKVGLETRGFLAGREVEHFVFPS